MPEELQKSTETNLTLVERLKISRSSSCLLLDVSTSMNSDVEPGKTKMEALVDIVEGLTGNPVTYLFGSTVRKVNRNEVPRKATDGATNMAPALRQIKLDGFKSAIMITDGDATDKSQTLIEIEGVSLQIMYVGSGNKPDFLDELAKKGGTFCTKQDLKLTKELTAKVQLLLGDPTEKRGSFQL